MRLPYAPREPPAAADGKPDPETVTIYERIAARRHPRPLIPLDLTLLHAPAVADGYNSFIGALRTKTLLPDALLELAISRIGVLTDAVYEWNAHAPLALKAGLPAPVLDYARKASVEDVKTAAKEILAGNQAAVEPAASTLTKQHIAILQYTDEVTLNVKVTDSTFEALRPLFSDRDIVELTTTIAGYNCVSRVLVALDVGENNAKEMKSVQEIEAGLASWKPAA